MAMTRRSAMLGAALGSTGLLSGCAEGYFFYPDTRIYTTPAQLGIAVEEIVFGDEVKLHGWWMPAAKPRATLVQAHGNAANVTNHVPLVAWLPSAGINVLSFDYRGFGRSEGSPTLDGVVADTRAALARARRQQASALPLVLLGQSLGGATSVRALAEDAAGDIKLLILDSAFASYRGIAREAAGRGLMSWLLPLALPGLPPEDRDPLSAMPRIRAPVLLLHGEQDSIIPIGHSERLHAAAVTSKQLIRIAGGQHLDALSRPDLRARVLAAINAYV